MSVSLVAKNSSPLADFGPALPARKSSASSEHPKASLTVEELAQRLNNLRPRIERLERLREELRNVR